MALLFALRRLRPLPPRRVFALAGSFALVPRLLDARARLLLCLLFTTWDEPGGRAIGLFAYPSLRPRGDPALRLRAICAIRRRRTLLRLRALRTDSVGVVASRGGVRATRFLAGLPRIVAIASCVLCAGGKRRGQCHADRQRGAEDAEGRIEVPHGAAPADALVGTSPVSIATMNAF
ncbi:hypothetical protein [Luteimonas viscosa]|uniref:hypothetical protein n=1 Tax=Luteimonas viscosa TaxID=1132694 RepID=UPI001CA3C18E|nr:hypothetical protein [Luteimonas viscosa]